MTADEALALLDIILAGQPLSNIQETVFRGVWDEETYAEIAEHATYEHSYVRDVGFKLWQLLSDALGQKVSKSNIRAILGQYARIQKGRDDRPDSLSSSQTNFVGADTNTFELEYPSGPVPLNSSFYIERQPLERQVYAEIDKPGSLIRIKGQRQTGKTSLLLRVLANGRQRGFSTVSISLHKADRDVFVSLDKFLRWFCANVSRQLQLPPQLDHYWDMDIGSKVSCTAYFEDYILERVQAPVIIVLDEVNQIFEYPAISGDFLPLLRSWYEDAKEFERWHTIRWVIAHCTDVYVPLNLHQSPFNIGLAIQLADFTDHQVLDLARRYGFCWESDQEGTSHEFRALINMVGRRPNLIRLALYFLRQSDASFDTFLETAPTLNGVYSNHLRSHLLALRSHPDLAHSYKQIVDAHDPIELEAITTYRLENLGLISLHGNKAAPACELYRIFFQSQLTDG
ncbi:MAG TPA: AAA-like domain-containing protein [Elainellaceae cyanobacterium]